MTEFGIPGSRDDGVRFGKCSYVLRVVAASAGFAGSDQVDTRYPRVKDGNASLLPVLDLQQGRVVWAKCGFRDQYQPLQSSLTDSCDPVEVARAIRRSTGCEKLYVADLDSLTGSVPPDLEIPEQLVRSGFRLLLDAHWKPVEGWSSLPPRWQRALERGIRPILSSETLAWSEFGMAFSLFRERSPVFSLDLRDGVPWLKTGASSLPAAELLARAVEIGFRDVIVLELSSVGSGAGLIYRQLLSDLIARFPSVTFVSGGGVRGQADVEGLRQLGCREVLVATAIHDGLFTVPTQK